MQGGMTTAACIAFQTWAVKRKGPVFVSMFSPVQTVCSGILSAIVLHQMIKVERYAIDQRNPKSRN